MKFPLVELNKEKKFWFISFMIYSVFFGVIFSLFIHEKSHLDKLTTLWWFVYAISIYICAYRNNGTKFLKFYLVMVIVGSINILVKKNFYMLLELVQLFPWIYMNWRLLQSINKYKNKQKLCA